jgi:predicted acetyltransferase
MGLEIRQPGPDEMTAIRELAVLSFNVPVEWARSGALPKAHPEHYLCAYEDARLLATTRDIPMRQWFGGRPIPTAGVASVATTPEARGTGLGGELMRALLRRARDRGAAVTTLFPATVPFYRRLGYEFGGTWTVYEARLADLPRAQTKVEVALLEGNDVSELRECYRRWASARTGPVEGDDDDWWTDRVLSRWVRDAATRAVVARGETGVEGYASFELRSRGHWQGFNVECTHLVAQTPHALAALLAYFRGYRGVGESLLWQGPQNEPAALLFDEEVMRVREQFRYMTRVLDVSAALEARGYPAGVSGEVVVEVDDDLFEENRGPFRLSVEDGKGRVERVDDGSSAMRLSIRALSGLYAGYLSPLDLAAVGAVDGDHPSAGLLGSLFSGPPPFTLDHF